MLAPRVDFLFTRPVTELGSLWSIQELGPLALTPTRWTMFKPPFCPNRACAFHLDPGPDFYTSFGSYKPKCRSHPVPRFRCKGCLRTFSRQTFRTDYYDHKPHLDAKLFGYLSSGLGLRESSRKMHLSRHCTVLKARKIGRHLSQLNLDLQGKWPAWARLQVDEQKT